MENVGGDGEENVWSSDHIDNQTPRRMRDVVDIFIAKKESKIRWAGHIARLVDNWWGHASPSGIREKENNHSVDLQREEVRTWRRWRVATRDKPLRSERIWIVGLDVWLYLNIIESSVLTAP